MESTPQKNLEILTGQLEQPINPTKLPLGKTETLASKKETFISSAYSIASENHPNRNEDAYFSIPEKGVFGVFDGVGGQANGALASKLVCEVVKNKLGNIPEGVLFDMVKDIVQSALISANDEILSKVQSFGDLSSTATVVVVHRDSAGNKAFIIGQVGDSRAYFLSDKNFNQLTQDDGLAVDPKVIKKINNTLDGSDLDKDEKHYFRERNIITNLFGDQMKPNVTIHLIPNNNDQKLLLSSDGVHDNLTDAEIESILRNNNGADVAAKLTQAALKRSQEKSFRSKADDMTALVVTMKKDGVGESSLVPPPQESLGGEESEEGYIIILAPGINYNEKTGEYILPGEQRFLASEPITIELDSTFLTKANRATVNGFVDLENEKIKEIKAHFRVAEPTAGSSVPTHVVINFIYGSNLSGDLYYPIEEFLSWKKSQVRPAPKAVPVESGVSEGDVAAEPEIVPVPPPPAPSEELPVELSEEDTYMEEEEFVVPQTLIDFVEDLAKYDRKLNGFLTSLKENHYTGTEYWGIKDALTQRRHLFSESDFNEAMKIVNEAEKEAKEKVAKKAEEENDEGEEMDVPETPPSGGMSGSNEDEKNFEYSMEKIEFYLYAVDFYNAKFSNLGFKNVTVTTSYGPSGFKVYFSKKNFLSKKRSYCNFNLVISEGQRISADLSSLVFDKFNKKEQTKIIETLSNYDFDQYLKNTIDVSGKYGDRKVVEFQGISGADVVVKFKKPKSSSAPAPEPVPEPVPAPEPTTVEPKKDDAEVPLAAPARAPEPALTPAPVSTPVPATPPAPAPKSNPIITPERPGGNPPPTVDAEATPASVAPQESSEKTELEKARHNYALEYNKWQSENGKLQKVLKKLGMDWKEATKSQSFVAAEKAYMEAKKLSRAGMVKKVEQPMKLWPNEPYPTNEASDQKIEEIRLRIGQLNKEKAERGKFVDVIAEIIRAGDIRSLYGFAFSTKKPSVCIGFILEAGACKVNTTQTLADFDKYGYMPNIKRSAIRSEILIELADKMNSLGLDPHDVISRVRTDIDSIDKNNYAEPDKITDKKIEDDKKYYTERADEALKKFEKSRYKIEVDPRLYEEIENERELLQKEAEKAVVDGPEKAFDWAKQTIVPLLQKYNRMLPPDPKKRAVVQALISSVPLTALLLATGSIGLAGAATYGGMRFGRSVLGATTGRLASTGAGKYWEKKGKKKEEEEKEEYAEKIVDMDKFEEAEKELMDFFEARAREKKRENLYKVGIAIGTGMATSLATGYGINHLSGKDQALQGGGKDATEHTTDKSPQDPLSPGNTREKSSWWKPNDNTTKPAVEISADTQISKPVMVVGSEHLDVVKSHGRISMFFKGAKIAELTEAKNGENNMVMSFSGDAEKILGVNHEEFTRQFRRLYENDFKGFSGHDRVINYDKPSLPNAIKVTENTTPPAAPEAPASLKQKFEGNGAKASENAGSQPGTTNAQTPPTPKPPPVPEPVKASVKVPVKAQPDAVPVSEPAVTETPKAEVAESQAPKSVSGGRPEPKVGFTPEPEPVKSDTNFDIKEGPEGEYVETVKTDIPVKQVPFESAGKNYQYDIESGEMTEVPQSGTGSIATKTFEVDGQKYEVGGEESGPILDNHTIIPKSTGTPVPEPSSTPDHLPGQSAAPEHLPSSGGKVTSTDLQEIEAQRARVQEILESSRKNATALRETMERSRAANAALEKSFESMPDNIKYSYLPTDKGSYLTHFKLDNSLYHITENSSTYSKALHLELPDHKLAEVAHTHSFQGKNILVLDDKYQQGSQYEFVRKAFNQASANEKYFGLLKGTKGETTVWPVPGVEKGSQIMILQGVKGNPNEIHVLLNGKEIAKGMFTEKGLGVALDRKLEHGFLRPRTVYEIEFGQKVEPKLKEIWEGLHQVKK